MGACASCRRPEWKSFRDHPILEQYKLGHMMGSGAFSEVWKATHVETKQVVALKIVFWRNPSVKAAHKKILMKEVEALTALKHENIVAMTDHLDDDKSLALCLEFLDGGGLLERLNAVEHYSEAEASELFRQMLSAVAYMHSQNFIHRDIKPENMVFAESPQTSKMKKTAPCLKLVDFGLARLHHTARSVKSRLGSPGFMSPEIIDFARHTPAMDVFALGVILFIMLTGQKPMKTEQAAKLSYYSFEAHEYPRMASHSWTRLSTPAKDLVLRMLERNPTKRITAEEALKHEWLVTKGGTQPVKLTNVGKQAEILAKERKQFKHMAHAIIAVNRMGPSMSARREEPQPFEVEDSERVKASSFHTEVKSLTMGNANDQSSTLVPAGSLLKTNSRNSQWDSQLLTTADEQYDSRAKSPIAVVEV